MQQPTRWTFAGFDIDLRASVLRKDREPVRIGPQAFRALAMLVSRGGELVTREELQKEIWGDRVHVDFEHGLNVCIRQVRTALGNDADGNPIVVTCPREGYRLGVPAKRLADVRGSSLQHWSAAAAVLAVIAAGYLLVPSVIADPGAPSNTSGPDRANVAIRNGDLTPQTVLNLVSLPAQPTRRAEAYAWYSRGRDRSIGRKPFAALPYFERAAALDSNFAAAQAGLAIAYVDRAGDGVAPAESVIKARQAAQRAFALDARSAETHVALAELSYRLDDDGLEAEREFVRAVELDGRNAYVRQRYAAFLREQRRFDEALEQLGVAVQLDPSSAVSSWQKEDTLLFARRWEESLAQAYHTLELDPTNTQSFRTIGQCLEAMGKREEAVEAYMKAGHKAWGLLGRVEALMGRRSAAREILTALTRRLIDETGHNGVAIAYVYMGLGEPTKAMEWLQRAHDDGVRLPFSLRVAPQWEPLRTSRAFDEFLKKNRVGGI